MANLKMNVLYFDDEPYITRALARSLESNNLNVTLVSEIEDVFKELNTGKYNIIMLDIMAPIPDINNKYFSPQEIDEMIEYQGINVGVILAKRIWKNYNKDIPILFFSAKSSPIVEYPELKKYKCDFLSKPQLASTVLEKLKELF